MARVEISRPPPVRIWRSNARVAQAQMLYEAERLANAAGGRGMREKRYASVPIALRIHKRGNPNTAAAQQRVISMERSRRKRGYPPIGGAG